MDSGGHRKDRVEDDLALWVRTNDGLVVVVGCAHAGIVNTLNYVRKLSNENTVRAVLGGFHLQNSGSFRLAQTIAALSSNDVKRVIPCHCTREFAIAKLRVTLGDKVTIGSAGMTYLF